MEYKISEEEAEKIIRQKLDDFAQSRNMFSRELNTGATLKCLPLKEGWECLLEGKREQIAMTLGELKMDEISDRR